MASPADRDAANRVLFNTETAAQHDAVVEDRAQAALDVDGIVSRDGSASVIGERAVLSIDEDAVAKAPQKSGRPTRW